jgi:hypothetical protein
MQIYMKYMLNRKLRISGFTEVLHLVKLQDIAHYDLLQVVIYI